MRISDVTDTVTRCTARQDGGWLVITKKGAHGVSDRELRLGSRVQIKDGRAVGAER